MCSLIKIMKVSPEIIFIPPTVFMGLHREISMIKNDTAEIFREFMPRRNEVENRTDKKIIDLRIYKQDYFTSFNPKNTFTKWACVRVSEAVNLPHEMDCHSMAGGLYARFSAPENPANPSEIFQFIFREWLPNSHYILDDRPHFDILNEGKPNTSSSGTQLIHIPIAEKRDRENQK